MIEDEDEKPETIGEPKNRGLWGAVIILICAVAISLGYGLYQSNVTHDLSSANSDAQAKLAETGREVQTLSQKLNALQAAQATAAQPATVANRRASERAQHTRRRPAVDHYKKLQAELAEHQKEIDATQQSVSSARTEFANNLSAAQNQLNGSIAMNHTELVALEKKGERNYFEFDIPKTKRFKRAGPVSIKLRKANMKHQYADLELIVNDREVTKKHVNIYEPVVFYPANDEPAMQLVINGILKDDVHGYVSTPKYTAAELAAANPPAAESAAPASSTSSSDAVTPTPGATPADLEHRPQP